MKSVLTIAGSDSSGGAGIQADLKVFSYAGVHGCSVITCVTAQNTKNVSLIHEAPLEVVEAQLDSVLEDVRMLYSPEIVELVARKCESFDFPLVVDPVMKATVGQKLYKSGFVDSLKNNLIPKSILVTPNIPEAEALTDMEIKTIEDMEKACKVIYGSGCENVLIKGGHLEEYKGTDVLYDGKDFKLFLSKVYPKEIHGTGCTFSALITSFLAKDMQMEDAVNEAKLHIGNIIKQGLKIGEEKDLAELIPKPVSEEEALVEEGLAIAVDEVIEILPQSFVPEVGINFGFALPKAKSIQDICALEGRLIRVGESIAHIGGCRFGASRHVAKIILTAMSFDKEMRSAMNIKYEENIIEVCGSLDFTIGTFNRKFEPKTASTMEWGTKSVIKKLGYVPDIIYDKGAHGKEPMIRIIGKNPDDVLEKLRKIVEKCG
jgi:hydroxymethylpyrimidine/phosphomethylpyrimidine kinase